MMDFLPGIILITAISLILGIVLGVLFPGR